MVAGMSWSAGNFQSATGSVPRVHATSLQRIGDKLTVPHNFELPPLLHPTTEAIAAVIVAMQDANWMHHRPGRYRDLR